MTSEQDSTRVSHVTDAKMMQRIIVGFGVVFMPWNLWSIYRAGWLSANFMERSPKSLFDAYFGVMASDLSAFVPPLADIWDIFLLGGFVILGLFYAVLYMFYKIGGAVEWFDNHSARPEADKNAE